MEGRKLLEQVSDACRARRFSPRTVEAYVGWIRRFVLHHDKRHPAELGPGVQVRRRANPPCPPRHT